MDLSPARHPVAGHCGILAPLLVHKQTITHPIILWWTNRGSGGYLIVMKTIVKQTCIGWVGNEIGKEIFVVIDSSPITSHSCNEAERRIEEGKFVPNFVPAVFLDSDLDSLELRSWLESEAA